MKVRNIKNVLKLIGVYFTLIIVSLGCDRDSSLNVDYYSFKKMDSVENNESKLQLCSKELDLLSLSNFGDTAIFDFSLTKEEQFDNLQSQIEKDICREFFTFDGQYIVGDNDTLTILTVIEKYSEYYVNDEPEKVEVPCVLVRPIRIFINENNEILLQNKVVPIDSLVSKVVIVSKDYFIEKRYRPSAYAFDWDVKSDIKIRKLVFKKVFDGFFIMANDYSVSKFGKEICMLNQDQWVIIRKTLIMAILLKYEEIIQPNPIQKKY